jgi:hypothetical protein
MPTPFVSTVFVVLTTLNNAGQLAPVDPKTITLPPPYTGVMFWSEQQCMYVRGRIEHPEKYVCQVFRGPKEIDWEFKPVITLKGIRSQILRPQKNSMAACSRSRIWRNITTTTKDSAVLSSTLLSGRAS